MDTQALALRVPPHSVEAEASVLGGLLLDNSAWDRIGDLVRPSDFYRADHRLIFECISKLIDGGKPADVVTVYEALQSLGKADEVGGIGYLNTLASETPSASNIRRYAEIVRDRSILRHLVSVSDEIATQALNPAGKETRQVLDEAESRIFQIGEAGARTTGGFQEFHSVLARVVEKVDDLYHNPNPSDVTGVPSGFVDLDQKTAGMHAGDLLIIAGRPSMGKTSLALNVAEYVAITEKLPVAVFSMEMGAEQLAMRVLCSVGKLDAQRVRTGRLTEDDWNRLTQAMGRMKEAQIHIDETPALNPLELRSRARRLSRQYGKLGLIVVDYLQLMSASSSGENRTTEISEITRSLKGLAKELGCPVLALSQLNRTVEQRTDKRPVMSDLRECVVGETLVSLADGSRRAVRDLVGQSPEVIAVDQHQKVITAKAEVIWSVGEKETFKVTVASGRSLVASAEHRVLTGSGWKTVAEMKQGDRVALARKTPEPARAVAVDEHKLILLGHLIGDGSYLKHQPLRYTTASEENSQAVTDAALAFGCAVTRHAGPTGTWHQLVISGNGNRWKPAGVGAWLKEIGVFGQRSHEKRIPDFVFSLSKEQLALFVRHLWATDGSITMRKTGRGSHRIYFATCSEGLARDLAALLLRFGIVARIKSVSQPKGRMLWNVDISGAEQMLLFLSECGAFGPKALSAELLKEQLIATVPNTNVDTMPIEVFEQVKARMAEQGITHRAMAAARGTSYGGSSHFKFAPSRETLNSYANVLNDQTLRDLAASDIFWDRVVDIAPQGKQEVFDLTVPGPASWVSDGIVNHNSGAIEQDADVILFIYRDEVYRPDTPDKGVAEIIIAKQRNGPIGTVRMTFLGQFTKFENFAPPAPTGFSSEY
jgi:replicative DNA helicase